MISVFWAVLGVGATTIVGSITTGNRRAALRSQPLSAVTVTCSCPVPAAQVAWWATFGLDALPYGDDGSGRASVMNGLGSTSTGGPPTPSRENAIGPSGRCHGVRPPPTVIVYDNDDAAAGDASVMDSFNASGVTRYDRSTPGATPA